jgi:hypothetical protein
MSTGSFKKLSDDGWLSGIGRPASARSEWNRPLVTVVAVSSGRDVAAARDRRGDGVDRSLLIAAERYAELAHVDPCLRERALQGLDSLFVYLPTDGGALGLGAACRFTAIAQWVARPESLDRAPERVTIKVWHRFLPTVVAREASGSK